MDRIPISWYAIKKGSIYCRSFSYHSHASANPLNSYIQSWLSKRFMTPSPGTCPRDSDKGITTDVMRTTMAATGDRNQRRIANLKTVNIDVIESDQNESDSDDDVVVCSLNGQKTIFCYFGWSNEKDRLESQSIYLTVWL